VSFKECQADLSGWRTEDEQNLNNDSGNIDSSYALVMTPTASLRRSVLVVDDEAMVREVVCAYLDREGFATFEAIDGEAALDCVAEREPDLIVLDVMLPKLDGYSVVTELRKHTQVPVILLTARADEVDRVLGLELGADDYVVKPFSPRELVARVRSVLRRSATPEHRTTILEFDELVIDGRTRDVLVRGEQVEMPPMEFDLLMYLASSPRQVFSRSQLLDHVWGSSTDWQDPSTVTVHIRRLRQKIESDADDPQRILTVWGRGYRFEP
jgi:DNA-binding response OmpR family regulator